MLLTFAIFLRLRNVWSLIMFYLWMLIWEINLQEVVFFLAEWISYYLIKIFEKFSVLCLQINWNSLKFFYWWVDKRQQMCHVNALLSEAWRHDIFVVERPTLFADNVSYLNLDPTVISLFTFRMIDIVLIVNQN